MVPRFWSKNNKILLCHLPFVFYGEIKILAGCSGCTQVITDDTYWSGPEVAELCGSNFIQPILQGVHGLPTITPIPKNIPCGQFITCDPPYDRVVMIADFGSGFSCFGDSADNFNTNINPFACDKDNSGLFIYRIFPFKAVLCYQV